MRQGTAKPTFSVLVNNYNYARFVERALTSATLQTDVDAEIIVVDDGSTDESRAVLNGWRDRATIIFQPNGGQASAINAAVRASQGEYLCFLDADDWWDPGKLSAVGAAFKSNLQAALVYHRLQPFQDEKPVMKPIPRTLCSGNLSRRLTRSAGWWPFPMTSAIAVRRSAWNAVGDIPEHFRISADAWLAGIYPFMGAVRSLPGSYGFYRIHTNNWFRPVDDAAMLRKRMAHWQATVDGTNRFLAARNFSERLSLADHHPYQVASAKLNGADMQARLALMVKGFGFAGEPSLLRRTRDALRTARELGRPGGSVELSEAAK